MIFIFAGKLIRQSYWIMFYLAGIVLTFFLSILLITKKGKSAADWILALWLFIIGLHLSFVFLAFTKKIYSFPYLIGLSFPFPLLQGPFLFLYTAALTNRNVGFKYKAAHFIPFLLLFFLFLPFYLLPSSEKIVIFKNQGLGYETKLTIMIVSIMISGVVYVALSLWLLNRHKRTIEDQFSSIGKINLAWLRYLIYSIGIIWLFVFVGNDFLIFNAVVVFVFFLGYFGIKQMGIFTQLYPPYRDYFTNVSEIIEESVLPTSNVPVPLSDIVTNKSDSTANAKYQRSSLTEESALRIHSALIELVRKNRPYINPELSLTELAKTLSVHPNNLSQVINTFEGKTFFDYINTLRIEEFKHLVTQPESEKFTLLALALDCGFNSKTSFNRNFKSATGLSPSEYLKKTQISFQE